MGSFMSELFQDLLALCIILGIFVYWYAKARRLSMKELIQEWKDNLKTLDGGEENE